MKSFELNAELREDEGRGASRRLRRTGKIPGVVYGGDKDAASITLDHDDVAHHLDNEAFYSHILTLNVGKEKNKVVLKDLQRHPVKPSLLHIDFQRINELEELTMRVPIHFMNEDECVGVKTNGGVVNHIMSEIEIVCLPKDLPEYIEIDLMGMDIGDSFHLNQVEFPEGVKSYDAEHGGDAEATIASIYLPREEPDEDEEDEAEAVPATEQGAEDSAEEGDGEGGDEDKDDKKSSDED